MEALAGKQIFKSSILGNGRKYSFLLLLYFYGIALYEGYKTLFPCTENSRRVGKILNLKLLIFASIIRNKLKHIENITWN